MTLFIIFRPILGENIFFFSKERGNMFRALKYTVENKWLHYCFLKKIKKCLKGKSISERIPAKLNMNIQTVCNFACSN